MEQELLKQILAKLEGMDKKIDGLDSKIEWAVAELKNNDIASGKAMTLFTPIETTEAIESDIRDIKLKLFDLESKVKRYR